MQSGTGIPDPSEIKGAASGLNIPSPYLQNSRHNIRQISRGPPQNGRGDRWISSLPEELFA